MSFKYKLPITKVLKGTYSSSVLATRFMEVDHWAADSFGPLNCRIAFESWDGYDGEGDWMFYANHEEDILAFKLKWGDSCD